MSGITEEEQIFLKKMEERKQKHKEAAAKYRQSNKSKVSEFNKTYNENQKSKMNEIKAKIPPRQQQPPTPLNIQEITEQKTNKNAITEDIKPLYEKRKEALTASTKEAYIIFLKRLDDKTIPMPKGTIIVPISDLRFQE
jgi:hypothetical protein